MENISIEMKRLIVEQNIAQYRNSVFDASIKIKVGKVLGDEDVTLEPLRKQMERFEKSIAILEKMLKELDVPAAPPAA